MYPVHYMWLDDQFTHGLRVLRIRSHRWLLLRRVRGDRCRWWYMSVGYRRFLVHNSVIRRRFGHCRLRLYLSEVHNSILDEHALMFPILNPPWANKIKWRSKVGYIMEYPWLYNIMARLPLISTAHTQTRKSHDFRYVIWETILHRLL